jgi:hypothetical protein
MVGVTALWDATVAAIQSLTARGPIQPTMSRQ